MRKTLELIDRIDRKLFSTRPRTKRLPPLAKAMYKRMYASWTHASTRAKGLKRKIFLTCAHTSSRLRHFNICIILPATHQGSVKALSKAKLWDYSGQTPQKRHLRKTFAISESVCVWEAIPGIWLIISSPKWNSQKGSRLYNRDKRRKTNHCPL